MAEKFDEFVEELERDIRQEKFLKIWNTHGKKIIYGGVAVLSVIALFMLWQNYETGKRLRLSQRYTGAQELIVKGKIEQAVEVLRELSTQRSTYQKLSTFLLAALLKEPGAKQDITGSLKLYESLAEDKHLEPVYRDFALLMAISLRVTQQESPDALLEKLKPLLATENPWRLQAMELQGVLFSQKGEILQAAEVFAAIARDSHVSQALLTRAQVMAQVLLQDAPASIETESSSKELPK
jgi:hypothetical protein